MNLSKKIIATALSVGLCATMLSSCNTKLPQLDGSASGSGAIPSSSAPVDDREPGFYLDGAKQSTDGILTIGEHEVSFDELRYYFLNISAQATASGETDDAKIRDAVVTALSTGYAMLDYAAKNNVTLNDEELAKVQADFDAQKAQFPSEDDYKAALDMSFLTDELLLINGQRQMLSTKASYETYKEDITKNVAEKFVHVKHILIKFPQEDAAAASASVSAIAADHTAQMAKATEVMDKIKAGEDFDSLITQYSEDGMPPEGYYFTTGEMVEPFETAAFALKDGEVSEIVESEFGYHIIKRYEFEESQMRIGAINYMSDDAYSKLTAELENISTAYEVKQGDLFDKMVAGSVA